MELCVTCDSMPLVHNAAINSDISNFWQTNSMKNAYGNCWHELIPLLPAANKGRQNRQEAK
jgi:hypothetical protein